MTGFAILDVVIGLSFVYLLLALICTTLMEWVAQVRNLRGRMLEEGTRHLLGQAAGEGSEVATKYFEHPLVRTLSGPGRAPSYVPSGVFVKALHDVLQQQPASGQLAATLRAVAGASGGPAGPDGVVPGGDNAALAQWYDQAMERLSGAYKRRTRVIVLGLAVAVTLVLNADTLVLTGRLWQNPTLRAYLVERAKTRLEQGAPLETVEYSDPTTPKPTPPVDSTKSPDRLLAEEQAMLGQLFGWEGQWAALTARTHSDGVLLGFLLWLLPRAVGWSLTALAVSLGAPFWFDTLNRFMSLRSTGNVTPKKPEGATA